LYFRVRLNPYDIAWRRDLSSFTPAAELVEDRARLRRLVESVVAKLRAGVLPDQAERQHVDCKEEAGRRGVGGRLLPGGPQNLAAADQLADEVACLCNTPGGGALIVGVENATGALLGTALDEEWLRHRIYERVDVAPAVEALVVDGVRLLVIYVAEAREPVEDTDGNVRWRAGPHCVPVDRAEWWLRRQDAAGQDPMAAVTERTLANASPGALPAARAYLMQDPRQDEVDVAVTTDADLLSRLGVRRPDGRLTQAGALMFCRSDRTHLTLTVLDVEGGDVLSVSPDLSGLSLLEQIAAIEARLDAVNTAVTVRGGFAETPVRRVPPRAVREAVLNGVAHRDWMQRDPVTITFVEADSALQVVSPGGFVGGVNADNVLTQRYARYPALADLFRALRLVEKQGMGVDRMYRDMVALGHRPPTLVEEPGPRVRVRLVGGEPVVPVMNLVSRIRPAVRQRDVRVALVVHTLLHEPFVQPGRMAVVLQRSEEEAAEALESTADCRIGDQPLLHRYKDVWTLSEAALALVERTPGVVPYRRPDDAAPVAQRWLAAHERFTTGDHAALTGLTVGGALRQLDRLARDGVLLRGTGMGRNAHFVAGPALRRTP
jgi:ATP-dependent DNA helicase RecG